eukprot:Plantae.Rhodophyta-Purpureofilum_apyrenoidigerum.ctg1120.p1 GENE.Plantae.Rhodophyta-Purpureofilum_apyrenoidigerum.ctg1120~~Plantae.Rhodophyta-Purpureofilum_apyrenoidigerum.ctg1120.p1  ORF type:complete len:319 (+),score=38.49 Plantae.Rhodophyta-Purpureofilum_apyrenoidigerum.ctg1120:96-1052(+)
MSSAAEIAEAAFLAHDFDHDEQFQEYAAKVDFVGAASESEATMKLKRRFYRQNVDRNLRKEPTLFRMGGAETQRQPETGNIGPTRPVSTDKVNRILEKAHLRIVLNVGTFLLCLAALLFFGDSESQQKRVARAHLIGAGSFLVSLMSTVQISRIDMRSLQTLMLMDDFAYLAFCLIFFFAPSVQGSIVPILVFSGFNTAVFAKSLASRTAPHVLRYGNIGGYIDRVIAMQHRILLSVANYEILLLAIVAFTFLTGKTKRSLFLPLSYISFLRFRYHGSSYSRHAWQYIDATILRLVNSYLPAAIPYYQQLKTLLIRLV